MNFIPRYYLRIRRSTKNPLTYSTTKTYFVLVSIDELCVSKWHGLLSAFIERCGVPVIARKRQAREFQHHAMEFSIAYRFDASADQEQRKLTGRTEFIVAGDDLSLLCKSYIKFGPYTKTKEHGTRLRKAFIQLDVLEGRSQLPLATRRAEHRIATYERRLLEPFRRLRGHPSVRINGAISAEYKSKILFEMIKAPQIAGDLLHSMTIAQSQAETQFDSGKRELACRTYQTIIEDVETGFEWPPKSGCPFQCPEMGASRCRNAICLAEMNVRNRLSEIYLELERPDQVRQWTNSALAMFRIHDDVTDSGGNKKLSAKMFYHLAWASNEMGVRCRALDEIWRARQQDPDNDVYKQCQQNWGEDEAKHPHVHGGIYPEACEGFWLVR